MSAKRVTIRQSNCLASTLASGILPSDENSFLTDAFVYSREFRRLKLIERGRTVGMSLRKRGERPEGSIEIFVELVDCRRRGRVFPKDLLQPRERTAGREDVGEQRRNRDEITRPELRACPPEGREDDRMAVIRCLRKERVDVVGNELQIELRFSGFVELPFEFVAAFCRRLAYSGAASVRICAMSLSRSMTNCAFSSRRARFCVVHDGSRSDDSRSRVPFLDVSRLSECFSCHDDGELVRRDLEVGARGCDRGLRAFAVRSGRRHDFVDAFFRGSHHPISYIGF